MSYILDYYVIEAAVRRMAGRAASSPPDSMGGRPR